VDVVGNENWRSYFGTSGIVNKKFDPLHFIIVAESVHKCEKMECKKEYT
jgi:hypothetical protein